MYNYASLAMMLGITQENTMFTLIIKTFTDFLASLQKAQQARADYWILTNMSDKELHDIGIARGEIRNVVAGNFK